MDVISVELLSLEAANELRRHARRERKEEWKRHEKMTMGDALAMDFSTLKARAAVRDSAAFAPQFAFASKGLNAYEATTAIAEFLFAQASQGKALLVEFSYSPSKAFEDRFRQAAKNRKIKIHFSRLNGGWVILTVQSKEIPDVLDNDFLKGLGIQW